MTQEQKMQATIAVGVCALLAAALFAMRENTRLNAPGSSNQRMGQAVTAQNGPAANTPLTANTAALTPRVATIALRSTSKAGQSGTATLTDLGGNRTRIVLVLSNPNLHSTQPANIHSGNCGDTATEPQYALMPLSKGRSETILTVNIGALIDKAPQSIRIRTDAVTPGAPYAACGELR